MSEPRASETARALRDAFDRSFAEAIAERPKTTSLLAVRVGGDPYALRLDEIAALHRDRTITPAASPLPELLGMAGFRGLIAPVYDLGLLLGYDREKSPRWLVLIRSAAPVALAFACFDAHLLVESSRLASIGSSARPHLDATLEGPEGSRPLIRVASLVEAITSKARSLSPKKER